MRASRSLWSGVVFSSVLLSSCSGPNDSADQKKAADVKASAKATVAAVTETAVPPPTETEAPAPTPTEAPPPTPAATATVAPTEPPAEEAGSAGDLKLLGIVRAGTPAAIISFKGRQEIFRRGDSVFDYGTVKEVREDSVVIHSGEKDVTLGLPKEEAPAPSATAAEDVVESKPPTAVAAPSAMTVPLSRAELRAGLKALASHLEKAEATRASVGGGHGLQLKSVESNSFFAKLGLRSGDVLQKLNGTPVDDLEHVPDLAAAADGRELTIGYTRDDIGLTIARPIQ